MRIALTGANGQLGQALCKRLAPRHTIIPLNQGSFELESPEAVEQVVATRPDLVLHPAAYTNVDSCARDPDTAYRVNALGTKHVALACQMLGVPLVYISTNEVFDGTSQTAYAEYDPANPINAYGWSKWCGEQAVRELLHRFYIVRVAWLFGGERNFVRTVLRLLNAPPEGGLRMVADEVSTPTYAPDAADAIARLVELPQPFYGTYHLVNSGACSRHEFAAEIARQAGHTSVEIAPIRLADYQRDSTPPPSTPLANRAGAALGIALRPWQEALADFLAALRGEANSPEQV
jgi:dTDP-4-dehydrorhamnose reductase